MDVHRIAVNRHKCFPTLLLEAAKICIVGFWSNGVSSVPILKRYSSGWASRELISGEPHSLQNQRYTPFTANF